MGDLTFGQQLGLSAGSDLLGTGLGLLTQNLQNKNNYKWGEKAAQNDFNRQMQLYERQYKDKSPLNVVNQLKEAGLNKGLMFSGGASNVGGAASGTTAGVNKMGSAAIQQKQNLAVTMAQLENLKAQTELTNEKAVTERESRPYNVEESKQRGKSIWFDNTRKEWENKGYNEADNVEVKKNKLYGQEAEITEKGLYSQQKIADLTKTNAEAGNAAANAALTNEKTLGYWTELLNATKSADAAATNAAANKLAAEFNYGEYTNFKYWLNQASNAVKAIK